MILAIAQSASVADDTKGNLHHIERLCRKARMYRADVILITECHCATSCAASNLGAFEKWESGCSAVSLLELD
jgi:predicted amidohydrolase